VATLTPEGMTVGLAPATAPQASAIGLAGPPVALYIHVPFCVSHCPYCDFVVVAGRAARGPSSRIDAFVAALEAELRLRADALDRRWGPPGLEDHGRPALDTLYFGGGTPSLLPGSTIARLLGLVRARFGLSPGAEVTIEANPGPGERGDLAALRKAGVSRLSIGAQSFDGAELRRLGRRHGPEDVVTTVAEARHAGIESVSLDLLYDIPGASMETWSASLEIALGLEPDHLSLYALTLDDPDADGLTGVGGDHLPLRPGARRWRERARRGQDDDRAAAMYEMADRRLAAAGFEWYEISNWARPGHGSRHNLAYWTGSSYEAVGPGAHAFDGRVRRWNAASLDGYLAALAPGDGRSPRLPPGGADPADPRARASEALILRLRTSRGVEGSALVGSGLRQAFDRALAEGLVDVTSNDGFALTLRGRLLSNELFARLL
jgi:coproporphyrinogen III oxidase-like Fe-S oxidoreductase